MQKLSVIVGLGMLLVISGAQAESDGMGYGMDTKKPVAKGQEMGMAQAAVVISAPADGAVLPANQPVKVSFQATPGPKGDHVHIIVDGERVAVLHQLSGDYELKKLSPGSHKISVQISTKDHQLIGVGKEISVEAR